MHAIIQTSLVASIYNPPTHTLTHLIRDAFKGHWLVDTYSYLLQDVQPTSFHNMHLSPMMKTPAVAIVGLQYCGLYDLI